MTLDFFLQIKSRGDRLRDLATSCLPCVENDYTKGGNDL